jgi:hypothetical protein
MSRRGVYARSAARVALWLGIIGLSTAIAYRLITAHFSVEGDEREVLAMALACPGLVLMIILLTRGR